ncbi:hypothetical protein LZ198_41200 [Myxococcus sp. K15C18031901]|uniref:hypothetical protein n=1 Tax=Myxococcus dinghuensis TaxID=2906761 RepID=UPI0020A80D1A|nr:hypothetical protein [Myxococcus dinghuensis]MCP3105305.1 hypothetical protein [Myxococcus dinghuensis]
MGTQPPSQLGLFDAAVAEPRPRARAVEPAREDDLDALPRGHVGPAAHPGHEPGPHVPARSRHPAVAAPPPTAGRLPSREDALLQAADLARRLSAALGAPVHLRLTDNRATLVSFRRLDAGLRLRVHHLFLDAPDAVVRAMAHYVAHDDAPSRDALEAHARAHKGLVRRERRPGRALRARGRCFDLHAVRDRLVATWFAAPVSVDIGWARRPSRGRHRSIHLGGYDAHLREIRIHPALDRPHVPAYVVDYLVLHALLHADLHEEDATGLDASGRCAPGHSPAFQEREARFPLRDAAQRWLQDNHTSLLRR